MALSTSASPARSSVLVSSTHASRVLVLDPSADMALASLLARLDDINEASEDLAFPPQRYAALKDLREIVCGF